VPPPPSDETPSFVYPTSAFDPPLGYSGRSSVIPRIKSDGDYIPVEDRWRIGFPAWDRAVYDSANPKNGDYPYQLGAWYDPFNQNVFKGDYPIIGQHTFLNITAQQISLFEGRQLPTPTTPFESTVHPFQEEFFGRNGQFFNQNYTSISFDLFHGDTAAFKPADWRIKLTPVFNLNYNGISELGNLSPNVLKGTDRIRTWWTLEEYFAEAKICDLSPDYDFMSARLGSQFFNSDFRGFIFAQTNRAVRLFGTTESNRNQFNFLYFRPTEKDINSGLNTFYDRPQNIMIGNYYHQDFIWPGYTAQGSIHWNNDLGGEPLFLAPSRGHVGRPHCIPVHRVVDLSVRAGELGQDSEGNQSAVSCRSALSDCCEGGRHHRSQRQSQAPVLCQSHRGRCVGLRACRHL
jgi:hypothetical protein